MKAFLSFMAGFVCIASFAADTNYPKTLAELNAWYVEPPAGRNAAMYYLQGFAAFKITDAGSTNLPLLGKGKLPLPDEPIPPTMKAAIGDFVQSNKSAMALLNQAAKFDQSRYPVNLSRGMFTLLPHLPKVKNASLVLELSALSHALDGRNKQAGDDLQISLALCHSLEAEPTLISQLVRVVCTVVAVGSLEQVLNRATLPTNALGQLATTIAALEEKEAAGFGFTRAFVGERLSGLVIFDEPMEKLLSDSDGISDEALSAEVRQIREKSAALRAKPLSEIRKIIAMDRQFYERTYDQVTAIRTKTFPVRLKLDDIFREAAVESTNKNYMLSGMFLPSLVETASREARTVAYLRLAQTAVALERFRVAMNHYPESLDQLSPNFLSAAPMDPFDGRPLRYGKKENGYVLYSIGDNLKDDSGTRTKLPDGDVVFAVVNPPKR